MQTPPSATKKINDLFIDESSYTERGLFEVESSSIFFDNVDYSSPRETVNQSKTRFDETPLYYKAVPLEKTACKLMPLGA